MDKYSTQVNTPPYNYGLNVLSILHKIVDNFRHNTKPLLPSKEYNIFQHNRLEGQTYYAKSCLDGTCSNCAGMALLSQCIHETGKNGSGFRRLDLLEFAVEVLSSIG